jgi:hypothetical protein
MQTALRLPITTPTVTLLPPDYLSPFLPSLVFSRFYSVSRSTAFFSL